ASSGRPPAPDAAGGALLAHPGGDPLGRPSTRRAHARSSLRARLFGRRDRSVAPGEQPMIDFYYWPTPNGWKVAIMLEECGLEYRMIPVNIGRGDQFKPEFLAISPNNRMPAIVDHNTPREFGDGPLPIFESGAILIHLAERTGRFMSQTRRGRKETLEWL